MARFIRRDGLVLRVGSATYKWWFRSRFRLTGAAARFKHPLNLRARTLALATHFLGVKEYPPGSNLQEFGRWYGEDGVPWCAIFVSYILSHAGRPFRYAYVPSIVADARANKNGLHPVAGGKVNLTLEAGYPVLACFDWNGDGTADHVAFATTATPTSVTVIGGNQGGGPLSAGGEVCYETQPINLVQLFVRVA